MDGQGPWPVARGPWLQVEDGTDRLREARDLQCSCGIVW